MTDIQISAFMAAAENGSFSGAAAELYLPKQAVSKYIQNLEYELQTTLFQRDTSPLTLTVAGMAYRDHFLKLRTQMLSVKQEVSDFLYQSSHRLRIGLLEWLDISGRLGDCLQSFQQDHQDAVLEIYRFDNQLLTTGLQNGNLDLVVSCGNRFTSQYLGPTDLENVDLTEENMCLYAPDWVEGDQIDSQCWGLPLIQRSSWEWSFIEWKYIGRMALLEFCISPQSILVVPNTQSLQARMLMGDCVSIADHNFGPLRNIPGLRHFRMPLESYMSCVWKSSNHSTLIPQFVAHLQNHLSKLK